MPVAVRIVRPYDSEEAFIENELETVGKTSVILLGARARPVGTILRFEMVLANGAMLLRGEGRVLSHGESAFRREPGLTLRFTRLDLRSKALVDRMQAIRDRAQVLRGAKPISSPPPMLARPKTIPPPSMVPLRVASSVPPPMSEEPPAKDHSLVPPPDREELLERLRRRASGLDADRIRAILSART
ncbi:MAG: hypothetical protein FWD69_04030 [Polyangiaceae bacterium]|nr:hypothetical protein [Polyangiaceae bacterium]